MINGLRILVVILICVAGVGALHKKFSSDSAGDIFADAQKAVSAQDSGVVSEPILLNEKDPETLPIPKKQERDAYLAGSNDPDIIYKKFLLAAYLYKKHESIQALSLAISYATQLGRFDEVSLLLKELPDIRSLKDTLETPVLMKLLMNTSDLSFAQLKQIKELIEVLKTQGRVSTHEYNMYYFVITLVKGDMENAQYYLTQIQHGSYAKQYLDLSALQTTVTEYGETPPYYLRALWAMYLYHQGRRGPARTIGQQIRQEDPTYLLAEQLIAYSSMALQDRKGASHSLQQLQKIDPSYSDVYQFFQAIAHYSLQEYEASILLFQQVPKTSVYATDVLRYIFLAHVALEDYEKIGDLLNQFLDMQDLQDADMYTLFDSLLYAQQHEKGYPLYQRFSEQIATLERRCQQELPEKQYICLYGKAGIFLASEEQEKAYQILHRIINRYPRVSLYTLLGDITSEQGSVDESEEWYRRAFLMQEENTELGLPSATQIGLQ